VTTTEAELTVGSRAPHVAIRDAGGALVQLASVWGEQPVALVFLAPLGGAFASECATLWRDAEEDLRAAGGRVVAVCSASPAEAEAFRHRWNIHYRVLTDTGAAFAAFGVSETRPGSFVIDGGGTVTYVHRNADELDNAPTWDLIDAVGAITGTPVERPVDAPQLDDGAGGLLGSEPYRVPAPSDFAAFAFTCAKCGFNSCEVLDVSSTSGMMSRMVNLQNRRFSAVVCGRCSYTEFYKTESGALRNIFDFLVGS